MTDQSYDVIVIGTGSGGKIAAQQLAEAGRRVLAVEAGRFGGECPYTACVPAKSLLASGQAGLSWEQAIERRDELTDGRDDKASRESLAEVGVAVRRGRATLQTRRDDRNRVLLESDDGDVELAAATVVIGTGSRPNVPPIDGLDTIEYWTSVDALSSTGQPERLVIIGGGAVGCELAQAYAQLGSQVDLIEIADELLPGEEPWAGALLREQLTSDGVRVHVGVEPARAESTASGVAIVLADHTTIETDRILVAGGRDPNSDDLGLDRVSAATDDKGSIAVDDRCQVLDDDGRAIPGLYAVGDVTGVSSYTHSANYQAKIIARHVLGTPGPAADYRAIPRVVYTEPPVFAVGLTCAQADEQGVTDHAATFEVGDVERANLLRIAGSGPGDEHDVRGRLQLVVDRDSGVLVGATCVGPQADAWGAELALAVRAQLTCDLLSEHVRAFPTWSEAVTGALEAL